MYAENNFGTAETPLKNENLIAFTDEPKRAIRKRFAESQKLNESEYEILHT